jgi:hypothetical protein
VSTLNWKKFTSAIVGVIAAIGIVVLIERVILDPDHTIRDLIVKAEWAVLIVVVGGAVYPKVKRIWEDLMATGSTGSGRKHFGFREVALIFSALGGSVLLWWAAGNAGVPK